MTESRPLLELNDVKKHFNQNDDLLSRLLGDQTQVKAVDGVSLKLEKGEALGVAGESGCGKSTLGKTILRLHEPTAGEIAFDGENVLTYEGEKLTAFRKDAQIIQQDPYQSLNPRFTVRSWVKEPLDIHDIGSPEERDEMVYKTVNDVGLKPPEMFLDEYPSELSGGQRQRVGIARAIVTDPAFVLCDEPVSMLDVSVRAEILTLLGRLQEERGMSLIYISHDLSLLKLVCDRIAIMYLGKVVERGPAKQIIDDPKHPYTQALVSSTPVIDPDVHHDRIELEGSVPDPVNIPSGCRFAPRCPEAMDECTTAEPPAYNVEESTVRCYLYDEDHANDEQTI